MKLILLLIGPFFSSLALASTPLASYAGEYTAANCAGLESATVQVDESAQTFTLQLTDVNGNVAKQMLDLNPRHSVHTQCIGVCTREIRTIVRGTAIIEQYREIGLMFKPLWTDEATLVKFGGSQESNDQDSHKTLGLPGFGENCKLL